jgi:asparagine synthase (glutamine-hydrolysing)
MCGIAGIINFNKERVDKDILKTMTDIISYRGPDDEGFYYDDDNGLGFGHRRLSIIDLTSLGHQPMSTDNNNIWITYNGEIYNYIELMDELKSKGYNFKSKSDTEVILKAYQEWGEDCINKFNGMWAFAIWDKKKNIIFCSRDRFGIKPFYYFCNNNVFVFGSEIKQILLHPEYTFSPNKEIIYDFLMFSLNDHTEMTFYKEIYQLKAAQSLILKINTNAKQPKIRQYWDIDLNKKIRLNRELDYMKMFYEVFYNSVNLRLRSDVPVGSCLSGGLDSSAIVCMVNKQLKELNQAFVQKTFSSCFEEKKFDEREYIEIVEQFTEVEGYHVFPDNENLVEKIENLVWHQDGPVHSISMFAQREVFKSARENNVIVMLDGQGGDEILAGYHKFLWEYLIQLLKELKLLRLIKEIISIRKKHSYKYKTIMWLVLKPLFVKTNTKSTSAKWLREEIHSTYLKKSRAKDILQTKFTSNNLNNWLYILLKFNNLPALLHYEDRNSMASSIEARVPFLDYTLVEMLFAFPDEIKIRDAVTKYLLRESLKSIMPEKIVKRIDKMGFVTPEKIWLNEIFKDKYLEILDYEEFQELGFFDINYLKTDFELFLNNASNPKVPYWKIISLGIWLKMMNDGVANNKENKV